MTACRDDRLQGKLQLILGELEETVRALGRAIWEEDRDWYRARFEELYEGGRHAFGTAGPGAGSRLDAELCLDAELWFLLDCPLDTGDPPLHRIGQRLGASAAQLLARSELRAWRIEFLDADGALGALCPLGTGRARLETARRPLGELTPGAILVARSVPLGPGRWGLLGRAPVVDRAAAGDFDALLASLDSPRGEFWRVHGGVLARAAWAWPEDREHTLDGHIVEGSMAAFQLLDAPAAVAVLACDPELENACEADGGIMRWRWCWDPPRARRRQAQAGVRDQLCDEDAAPRPFLAQVVLDIAVPEVCLLAPTPARLALAERLLAARLGPALGQRMLREVDPPSVVPRWKRTAFERDLEPLRSGRRTRRRAA